MTVMAIVLAFAFIVEHVRRKMATTPDVGSRLELLLAHEEYAGLSHRYDLLAEQYEDLLEATRDPADMCAADYEAGAVAAAIVEDREVGMLEDLLNLPSAEVDR